MQILNFHIGQKMHKNAFLLVLWLTESTYLFLLGVINITCWLFPPVGPQNEDEVRFKEEALVKFVVTEAEI